MSLIVQKFGGSSVATVEQIQDIAKNVTALKQKGHQVIVVVSAMGKTTDQLSALAYQVSKTPTRRELDMLLSTGERVASSLMAMAISDQGCEAISLTGSQAGILTDDSHTNAQIIDIRPIRIEEELKKNRVIVLAGFQGVSPKTKEITTLGRGGTDLTAVAMAQYFKSERCEILKEVDGVYSADPKLVSNARQIPELNFQTLQELTFWGAKMIHHRAAELAANNKLPIYVGLAHGKGTGTLIHEGVKMFEEKRILSVNSHNQVLKIQITSSSQGESYKLFGAFLKKNNLPWPQILDSTQSEKGCFMLITAPLEALESITNLSQKVNEINMASTNLASVTATCAGAIGSDLIGNLTMKLDEKGYKPYHVLLSPMSVTYIVDSKDRESVIKVLHG